MDDIVTRALARLRAPYRGAPVDLVMALALVVAAMGVVATG